MGTMDEDFEIEPVWERLDKPKKVNSGRKGDRGEHGVIDLLTERFHMPFSRVPDSGARMSQVALPEELKQAYVGDIVVPPNFKFCIECKNGYDDDISLENIIFKNRKNAVLDGFLEQAQRDADRVGKKPMLCWKKTSKPYLAFTKEYKVSEYGLYYRDWVACQLTDLLKLPDDIFLAT
jgi:hypothetical protein